MWYDKDRIKSNISGHLHERNDRQSIMRTIRSIFGQFLGTNGIFEYSWSYWWLNAPEIASKSYMRWSFYRERFIDRKSSALFNLSKLNIAMNLTPRAPRTLKSLLKISTKISTENHGLDKWIKFRLQNQIHLILLSKSSLSWWPKILPLSQLSLVRFLTWIFSKSRQNLSWSKSILYR